MKFQKGHKINLGRKISPAHHEKMMKSRNARRHTHTEEAKLKMKLANLGKRYSPKTEFTKESMSRDKHWNWKGGISKIDRIIRRTPEYLKWRSDVFQRDLWTCQTCKVRGYVTAHHIKSFSSILREYEIKCLEDARRCDELWDIKNGVTLCETCHSLTDNYKGKAIVLQGKK